MFVFFFKQKTAYEMRISDWSSDVCSSDLACMPKFICTGMFGVSSFALAMPPPYQHEAAVNKGLWQAAIQAIVPPQQYPTTTERPAVDTACAAASTSIRVC